MLRRVVSLLVCLLLIAPTALAAGFDTIPSREIFSMAYDRLQKAIKRERPVMWQVTITPEATDSYADGAAEAINTIISVLELNGNVQCNKDGGRFEVNILSDRSEIGSIGQVNQEERTGLNLNGDWLSIQRGMETEAAVILDLDSFGRSLLMMDYSGIREGTIPFLTTAYNQGITLWELASPYSADSNRLSVPSGSTGHGMVYEIDTAAFRAIVSKWVDQLVNEGLSVGIPGTEFTFGISDEKFDAFASRMRSFGEASEVTQPIKLTMAFGEGDLLRTAKGSGTIAHDGKRKGVSYNYRCDLSSTRLTRKYNIDFAPNSADTLVLTGTWLNSSNNKSSGAHEIAFTVSGMFDGQPYRLKISNNLVNKYGLDDAGILSENITGTLKASLTYAGATVAEVTVKRDGQATSSAGLTTGVSIVDNYDVHITNDAGTIFKGLVSVGYDVADGTQELPDVLADATKLEDMDFIDMEILRESLYDVLATAKQRLVQALPLSAMAALLTPY